MITHNQCLCHYLDCFSAVQTHVISRGEMESNNSGTEESKDAKPPTENETVTANPTPSSEETAKEEVKEAESATEPQANQKRTLEGEEEDDDTKKKRRKGLSLVFFHCSKH